MNRNRTAGRPPFWQLLASLLCLAPAGLTAQAADTPGPPVNTVFVKAYDLEGATVFPDSELLPLLAPFTDRVMAIGELFKAAAAISGYYRDHGKLATADLPEQEVTNGTILIRVTESRLEGVDLAYKAKGDRPHDWILRDWIARAYILGRLKLGDIIDTRSLASADPFLADLGGIKAKTAVQEGTVSGKSRILITVEEQAVDSYSLSMDNSGSVSTGQESLASNANFDGPAGFGEKFTVGVSGSAGSSALTLSLSVPIGPFGFSSGINGNLSAYKLGAAFESLGITGGTYGGGLNLGQYLIHSDEANLSLKAVYNFTRSEDRLGGQVSGGKLGHIGSFALSGDFKDKILAGGATDGSLTGTLGLIDLSPSAGALDADQAGPRANGIFPKAGFTLNRKQDLVKDLALTLALRGQFAFKNLDSGQKMSLGGMGGVRAYPSSEASGDHGILGKADLTYKLPWDLALTAFLDSGWIQQHQETWTGWDEGSTVPNGYGLSGYGLNLTWKPGKFTLFLTVAKRIGTNPAADPQTGMDGDGTRQEPRLWMGASLNY